ncbi:hypothetical protein X975_17132, partial [Stegodyphus mimosarum]
MSTKSLVGTNELEIWWRRLEDSWIFRCGPNDGYLLGSSALEKTTSQAVFSRFLVGCDPRVPNG